MAKNYTLKEAANIIAEGKKKDEIIEIGRRFPLLAVSLAAVIAQANDKFLDFINYMPDHITANKINSAMKADVEEAEADSDEDEAEAETPAKAEKSEKKAAKKAEAETDSDYSAISGSKLYDMIKAAGKLKDLKAKGFGTKKADLVAYLEQNPLEAEAEDEAEAEEAETEESGKYDDMNAMELFKECKKRGIKAAPKKPAKFYVELLEKDDAANADSDEAEAEDEDWDDEEPEEKPVKKSEKKPAKKAEKKPAKKSEPAEDEEEDDDWDI